VFGILDDFGVAIVTMTLPEMWHLPPLIIRLGVGPA